MLQNNIGLRLLVRGRPITEYHYQSPNHPHERQTFVEGREGNSYKIEITNRHAVRVAAVVSVDGLSIMNGQPAGPGSGAYILAPWESIVIEGWKLSGNQSAAEFVFGGISYAEHQTGSDQNNGVVGAIFYAEKARAPVHRMPDRFYPQSGVLRDAPSRSMAASLSKGNMGTGFGKETEFRTKEVEFERGVPLGTLLLYYDGAQGLRRRGIIVGQQPIPETPQAFPADNGCVPPPGWTGGNQNTW